MATLIACATGNFTSSSSWATGANELDSITSTTTVSTSNTDGQTFAPGAITVDGVALKIRSRSSSPTGTFTVTLRNSTDGVDVASVTVDVADLPIGIDTSGSSNFINQGWTFFKFATSHTLSVGKNYLIRVVSSSASQVVLWRDGTIGNVSRVLRTTTNAAPGSGDKLIISGELTGQGARTDLTVTMDNTASTTFGSVSFPASLTIGSGGTLSFGTSSSTAYLLTIAGNIIVFDGGVFNIGTSGARIPSTSTATLQFDLTANVDSGLIVGYGGTFRIYGATKSVLWTKLTADKSATDTSISVTSTSGWAANDVLAFASTTRTPADCEEKTISTVDSGTAVTLSSGLANAHSGSGRIAGEVANLTRNAKFYGESGSLNAFFQVWDGATVTVEYAEFRYVGNNSTTDKQACVNHGLRTAGSVSISYSAIRDCGRGFVIVSTTYNYGAFTLQSNVCYNVVQHAISIPAITATNWTIADFACIRSTSSSVSAIVIASLSGAISDVVCVGSSETGIQITHTGNSGITSFWDGLVSHSHTVYGVQFNGSTITADMFFRDVHAWRNATGGIVWTGSAAGHAQFINGEVFGNAVGGIRVTVSVPIIRLLFSGFEIAGDSTFAQPSGYLSAAGGSVDVQFHNCLFGQATDILVNHSTNDITHNGGYTDILLNDCYLYSGTPVATLSGARPGSKIRYQSAQQTGGSHRVDYLSGTVSRDTTIYRTASPSVRMAPSTTIYKRRSSVMLAPVSASGTPTIAVYVRKSVSGDGAAYNGAEPRLIILADASLGIDEDTVLDTASGSAGSWEQLSGVLPAADEAGVVRVVVDCDGTAGWVNVDDFSVS